MNVTATNAASVLEEWPELVRRCEFYTVDQEMTGIDGDGPLDRAASLDVTYKNVSTAVQKFCAFQFGICLFERKDGKSGDGAAMGSDSEYIVRPFSFWLLNDDVTVSLSTSAVKFLLKNNMNYQFWLENGFEFGPSDGNTCPQYEDLNEEERSWVKEHFEGINKWYDSPPSTESAESQQESTSTQEPTPAVATPASELASPDTVVGSEPRKKNSKFEKKDEPKDEYLLSSFVSARADVFLHYLLYAQTSYVPRGQVVPDAIKSNSGRQSVFNAVSTKLLTGRDPRWPRTWFSRLPSDKGIETHTLRTKVTFHPFFKTLIESKKTHVGHNYLTDLMFEVNQHHLPLPSAYSDFRQLLKSLFPSIYDTKVLGQLVGSPSKHSDLGSMFKEYTERGRKAGVSKKFKFPLGFTDLTRTDQQCAHDGSYDAFMTGIVFLYAISTSGTKAGIEEGYAKYEGIIAQFASSFWVALRREEDVPAAINKVRAIVLGLPMPDDDNPLVEKDKAAAP